MCTNRQSLAVPQKTQSRDLRHLLVKQSDVINRLAERGFQRSHELQIPGLSSQEYSRAALGFLALISRQQKVYFRARISQN